MRIPTSRFTIPALIVMALIMLCAQARADEKLTEFATTGNWQAGQAYYEKAILDVFNQGERPGTREVAGLYRSYMVCRYFPYMGQRTLSQAQQKQLLTWLWRNSGFTNTLLFAFRPQDDPARSFEVLYKLLKEDADRVKNREQLATAYAVVWDSGRIGALSLEDSWDYFTDSDTELTYSVRRMPYQLSKYVIDLQRPEKDLEWAQGKYSGEGNIGRLYERIWKEKYDRDAFYRGEPAEIEAHANTLENIYEYGGVCTHAAQFATGVGKAVGVPCVTITGASQGGIGHAWVGFVRTGGPARLQWDVNSGRIGDNDAYVGHVRDPHTGQTYAEHELNLAVLAMATSESKRLRADVWRGVSELLARNGQGAQAEWAMEQSLDTAVYDKAQWQAYAALVQRGTVKGEDALNTAEALVEKLEDWPGLAVDAFSAIILADRTMDADKKVEEIDDMAGEFRRNEYAQARAVILKGTVLELAGEQARAVETYEEGVEDLLDTSLGLRVLDHAGRLYVDMGKLEEAIDLHEDAWDKADRPTRTHAYIRYTTWFQIGQRLAALHALAGEPDDQEETIERMVRLTDADGDEADFLEGQLAKVGYHAVNTTRAPQGVQ